jgi:hypothetical protein
LSSKTLFCWYCAVCALESFNTIRRNTVINVEIKDLFI